VGTAEEAFDDEQVRILLIGTTEEVDQGLTLIHTHLCRRICAWLRRRPWAAWMSSEDLADTWQDVLLGVLSAVRDGRFDADRPVIPLLLSIARARAIDRCRRKDSSERALAAVGEALQGTRVGLAWQARLARERQEMLACVREVVLGLPEKQRRVMQAFIDGYPDTASMETLRIEVSSVSGQEETVAAVKRALQEARQKVRERLRAQGFEIGK